MPPFVSHLMQFTRPFAWISSQDWTPGACASKATRHYIVGDMSEIMELARYLMKASPHMAALLARGDTSVPNNIDVLQEQTTEARLNSLYPRSTPPPR